MISNDCCFCLTTIIRIELLLSAIYCIEKYNYKRLINYIKQVEA